MSSHYSTVKNSQIGEKTEKSYSEKVKLSEVESVTSEIDLDEIEKKIYEELP